MKQEQVSDSAINHFSSPSKLTYPAHLEPQPSTTDTEYIQPTTINPAVLRRPVPPTAPLDPSSSSLRQTDSEPERWDTSADQVPPAGDVPMSSLPQDDEYSDADGEGEDERFDATHEEYEKHVEMKDTIKAISATYDTDEAIQEVMSEERDAIDNQKARDLDDGPVVVSDRDEPSSPITPARGSHRRNRVGALRGSSPDDIVYVGQASGSNTAHARFNALSGKTLPASTSASATAKPPPFKPLIRAKNKFTPPSRRSDRVLARSPAAASSPPPPRGPTTVTAGSVKIKVPALSRQSAVSSSRATSAASSSRKRALESDDEDDVLPRVYERMNDEARSPATRKRRSPSGSQPRVKRERLSTERSATPDPRFQKPAKMLGKSDGKRRGTGEWPKLPKEATASLMMVSAV